MNNDLSHIRRKILKNFGATAALGILNRYSSAEAEPAYITPIPTSVPFSTGNPVINIKCYHIEITSVAFYTCVSARRKLNNTDQDYYIKL